MRKSFLISKRTKLYSILILEQSFRNPFLLKIDIIFHRFPNRNFQNKLFTFILRTCLYSTGRFAQRKLFFFLSARTCWRRSLKFHPRIFHPYNIFYRFLLLTSSHNLNSLVYTYSFVNYDPDKKIFSQSYSWFLNNYFVWRNFHDMFQWTFKVVFASLKTPLRENPPRLYSIK